MKKNLLAVIILALVLVNLILTAVLVFSIIPQTKKSNELIDQVCAAINIELEMYTPLFAIARVPGWCAHRVEEVVFANRIIRPAYKYLGVRQKYKPIEER